MAKPKPLIRPLQDSDLAASPPNSEHTSPRGTLQLRDPTGPNGIFQPGRLPVTELVGSQAPR
jgi:hypothetical protein